MVYPRTVGGLSRSGSGRYARWFDRLQRRLIRWSPHWRVFAKWPNRLLSPRVMVLINWVDSRRRFILSCSPIWIFNDVQVRLLCWTGSIYRLMFSPLRCLNSFPGQISSPWEFLRKSLRRKFASSVCVLNRPLGSKLDPIKKNQSRINLIYPLIK